MSTPVEPFTAEGLSARLSADRMKTVIVSAVTGSTNRDIRAMAMIDALNDGTVVVAGGQNAGRGRFGRSFESPRGKGIYLSLYLDNESLTVKREDITPMAAVAVLNAVQRLYEVTPDIKWVNDLVYHGKKIGGILAEAVTVPGSTAPRGIVLGIGINCTTEPADFPYEVRKIASSLTAETGRTVSRLDFTAALIEELDRVIRHGECSREDCLAFYRAHCLSIGQKVQILRGDTRREAVSLALEDDFSLRVRYEDGMEEAVSSGEVSVRGLYGYMD